MHVLTSSNEFRVLDKKFFNWQCTILVLQPISSYSFGAANSAAHNFIFRSTKNGTMGKNETAKTMAARLTGQRPTRQARKSATQNNTNKPPWIDPKILTAAG